MMNEWVCCHDDVVNHQLPSCGLLSHPNSFRGRIFKLNTKFGADLLLYSVISNAMATQYTCLLNSIYRPY